jgi:hypothetical protein
MKRFFLAMGVVALALLLVCATSIQAQKPPSVSIKLVKKPPRGLLELEVGESHTFEVRIKSSEPFVMAGALVDQYYPGRGVYWHNDAHAGPGTEAVLYLTVTGKSSTAELPAVCDWPEPGDCWPAGTAPVSIVAGVRFQGGSLVAEQFPFAIHVP